MEEQFIFFQCHNLMSYNETRALIDKHDIRPTRSLGQNFLIDDRVVSSICEAAELCMEDLVIEIGPGLGVLTLAAAKMAGQVTAIEIDRHMLPVLNDVLAGCDNTRIVMQDALAVDLPKLAAGWQGKTKVAANLPYYITTEMVVRLISRLPFAAIMILMMQKEAADRIFAMPGSKMYGPSSVLAHLYGDIEKIMTVPASAYYPQPHVASVIIKLTRREPQSNFMLNPPDCIKTNDRIDLVKTDWLALTKFIEACFCQRRKTLVNSLKQSSYSAFASDCLKGYLKNNALGLDARAESIEPPRFLDMFYLFQQL